MVKEDTTQYHEIPVIQVEGKNIDDPQNGIPMINIVTEKKCFEVTPVVVDIDLDDEKQPLNNKTDKKDSADQNGRFSLPFH